LRNGRKARASPNTGAEVGEVVERVRESEEEEADTLFPPSPPPLAPLPPTHPRSLHLSIFEPITYSGDASIFDHIAYRVRFIATTKPLILKCAFFIVLFFHPTI
jgi:hypothetical protein